jgi:hypothetical protein
VISSCFYFLNDLLVFGLGTLRLRLAISLPEAAVPVPLVQFREW